VEQAAEKKSYYVNGRGQIVEMLKLLTLKERSKLLNLIKARNPTMANELAEDSLGFENLVDLKDDSWRILMSSACRRRCSWLYCPR
jgi:flagellar motor switch protein FliG